MHLRYLLIIFFLAFAIYSSAQTKQQYSHLAKRQATWGWIVAGTVPVFTALAFVVEEPEQTGYITINEPSNRTGMFIMAGTAAVVSGVLLIASSKNKKKAASMVIEQRSLIGVYALHGISTKQTTFTMQIPLRNK